MCSNQTGMPSVCDLEGYCRYSFESDCGSSGQSTQDRRGRLINSKARARFGACFLVDCVDESSFAS